MVDALICVNKIQVRGADQDELILQRFNSEFLSKFKTKMAALFAILLSLSTAQAAVFGDASNAAIVDLRYTQFEGTSNSTLG